jgi:hypothetical protein
MLAQLYELDIYYYSLYYFQFFLLSSSFALRWAKNEGLWGTLEE